MRRLQAFLVRTLRDWLRSSRHVDRSHRQGRLGVENLEQRELLSFSWGEYWPEYRDRVDRLITQIQRGSHSDLAFFKNLNAWIYHSLAGGGAALHRHNNANGYLADRWANCGDRDVIMRVVASRLGVPARRIGLYGVPVQLGHTITEVFVDRRWHVFDPSAGVYFTRRGSSAPLSFRDARQSFPSIRVWQARTKAFLGRWTSERRFAYRVRAGNFIYTAERAVNFDIRRTYFISHTLGGDVPAPTSAWSRIDLDRTPQGRLRSARVRVPGSSGRQAAAIGWNGTSNTEANFLLLSSVPTTVTFNVATGGAPLYADVDHVVTDASYDNTLVTKRVRAGLTSFEFQVQVPGTVLRLSSAWGRAARVASYRWSAATPLTSTPAGGSTAVSGIAMPTPDVDYLPAYYLDLAASSQGGLGAFDRRSKDLTVTPQSFSYGLVNAPGLLAVGQRFGALTTGQQFLLRTDRPRVVSFRMFLIGRGAAGLRADATQLTAGGHGYPARVRTSVRQRVVTFSFRLQAPVALLRIYNADGLSGYVDAYRWLGRPL